MQDFYIFSVKWESSIWLSQDSELDTMSAHKES